MSYPSPLSQPHPGVGASIRPAPAAPAPPPAPRRSRGTGAALIWVGGVLVLVLLGLVAYFVRFLGPGASVAGMILAAIPFVGVWLAVRIVDRWEPEPRGLVVFAIAWGAIASVAIALAVDLGLVLLFGMGESWVGSVVQAPIVEEVAKGLGVLLIYATARRAFNGPVDGVVYGALVGAGFAFTENIQYFAVSLLEGGVAELTLTFFLRAVLSPFAHVMFTAMTGFALGLAARRAAGAGTTLGYFLAGLVVAIALHALWNGSAVFADFFGMYITLQVPLFVVFILGIVLLRREEARLTRARLGEYAAAGWFTPQEVDMLATGPGRRAALAWARTLRGDRRALMRSFIADATALAAARERALTGRDPHAAEAERELLARSSHTRLALFAP
ncbi:PrsW family intramembrane metalloprotease [Microbacterium sp. dk485]|uniref:PrsW family intramembrane metalloprotease n=1 Tax=Microbacterium TaxID=33882 RepID=UPI0010733486|nr:MULTISPECIES: PrsW family intramembrane metalloprotease [Microbacterium]TFV83593.1 PrsW family intramembrane metalloprotease [Microbacterium sp. dk485]TXK17924.1 PrsW family intramembrane metalloprotease [Microbacterium wangchenii]